MHSNSNSMIEDQQVYFKEKTESFFCKCFIASSIVILCEKFLFKNASKIETIFEISLNVFLDFVKIYI